MKRIEWILTGVFALCATAPAVFGGEKVYRLTGERGVVTLRIMSGPGGDTVVRDDYYKGEWGRTLTSDSVTRVPGFMWVTYRIAANPVVDGPHARNRHVRVRYRRSVDGTLTEVEPRGRRTDGLGGYSGQRSVSPELDRLYDHALELASNKRDPSGTVPLSFNSLPEAAQLLHSVVDQTSPSDPLHAEAKQKLAELSAQTQVGLADLAQAHGKTARANTLLRAAARTPDLSSAMRTQIARRLRFPRQDTALPDGKLVRELSGRSVPRDEVLALWDPTNKRTTYVHFMNPAANSAASLQRSVLGVADRVSPPAVVEPVAEKPRRGGGRGRAASGGLIKSIGD